VARSLVATCAAVVLGLSQPAGASEMFYLPVSQDPGVLAAQQTMLEAWETVDEIFFDSDALVNWDQKLQTAMEAAYASGSKESVFSEIENMLQSLGDPYTRLVPSRCASTVPVATAPAGESASCPTAPVYPDSRARPPALSLAPRDIILVLLCVGRHEHRWVRLWFSAE
jgi:hypothetical protein